jgi:uncharacterized membrane protein YgdD (TMEM256/DUF423 family)
MKIIAIIGAILGLTSVVMGAASDHLFSEFITADNAERLDVALRYHQLYAILIFCMGLYGLHTQYRLLFKWAGYTLSAGTIIFCAGLYISLVPAMGWLVKIVPVGGVTITVGWLFCLIGVTRYTLTQPA